MQMPREESMPVQTWAGQGRGKPPLRRGLARHRLLWGFPLLAANVQIREKRPTPPQMAPGNADKMGLYVNTCSKQQIEYM